MSTRVRVKRSQAQCYDCGLFFSPAHCISTKEHPLRGPQEFGVTVYRCRACHCLFHEDVEVVARKCLAALSKLAPSKARTIIAEYHTARKDAPALAAHAALTRQAFAASADCTTEKE